MRAAAARACRNPSKPIGFSTFSTSHVNKTYENTTLSHRKILKFCSRALAGSFKNQWFFNIYVTRGFAGNFSRARRTHSTTAARVPEAQSLSNNTMRGTCARPRASSSSSSLSLSSSSSRAHRCDHLFRKSGNPWRLSPSI